MRKGCRLNTNDVPVAALEKTYNDTVRTILVTGGAGFIGSWFVRHLTHTYHNTYSVVCYDNLDYCATKNNIECLKGASNFIFEHGDIADKAKVVRCIQTHRIDTIVHLAAMSHVDRSFEHPVSFAYNNVIGTLTLLEAAASCRVKRFIYMSTDEVFGERQLEQLVPGSAFEPSNPYAASKAAGELFVQAYAKSYSLPCIIARSNNVYGPQQYPEKIIPRFIIRLLHGRPVSLHGSGLNKRCYIYVSDVVDALDTILHKGLPGRTYCITSPEEISNSLVAQRLLRAFGIPDSDMANLIRYVEDRPFNDASYSMDGDDLSALGWRQTVGFDEGISRTIEWYKRHGQDWWDCRSSSRL